LRVSLVGVSCVGTTTIGRILADRRGWPFYDIDSQRIVKQLTDEERGLQLQEGKADFSYIKRPRLNRCAREPGSADAPPGAAARPAKVQFPLSQRGSHRCPAGPYPKDAARRECPSRKGQLAKVVPCRPGSVMERRRGDPGR